MAPVISDLSPAEVLAGAEAALTERRAAQVKDLLLVLQWADLHGTDPQAEPGAVPARFAATGWSTWAVTAPRPCRTCAWPSWRSPGRPTPPRPGR